MALVFRWDGECTRHAVPISVRKEFRDVSCGISVRKEFRDGSRGISVWTGAGAPRGSASAQRRASAQRVGAAQRVSAARQREYVGRRS